MGRVPVSNTTRRLNVALRVAAVGMRSALSFALAMVHANQGLSPMNVMPMRVSRVPVGPIALMMVTVPRATVVTSTVLVAVTRVPTNF